MATFTALAKPLNISAIQRYISGLGEIFVYRNYFQVGCQYDTHPVRIQIICVRYYCPGLDKYQSTVARTTRQNLN